MCRSSLTGIGLLLASLGAIPGAAGCEASGGDSCLSCGDPAAFDSYPAGPFGTTEGAVLEEFTFQQADGTPVTLSDLRGDGDKRLLMVTTSSWWCTACIDEQPTLKELYAEWAPKGLEMVVTLFEEADYSVITLAGVQKWKDEFATTFPVVADPDFQFEPFYDATFTPMVMFVDLCTMEILSIRTGFDRSLVETTLAARLCGSE